MPPTYPAAPPAPPTYPSAPPHQAPATHQAPPAYPAPTAYPAPLAYPGAPVYPPNQNLPAAPGYPTAPPGAYQVPVGGYAAPSGAYAVPDTTPRRSAVFGVLALVLALVAAVVAPVIASINAFAIGQVLPRNFTGSTGDFSALSPARMQVLWTELSFWTGTIFGIAAIVLGIIAIRKKQGRGAGIAALILAVLGVVIFFVVLVIALGAGAATGYSPYTA